MLGIVITAGIIGIGVSGVSAQPETGAEETLSESGEAEEGPEEAEEEAEPSEEEEAADPEDSEEEIQAEAEEAPEELQQEEEQETAGMEIFLENTLDCDVTAVEVSSFAGDTYSQNLLTGGQLLKTGETTEVRIPEEFQDPELGLYNVRLQLADGTAAEIPFVPLLEQAQGRICREEHTVLIRVRDERLETGEEQIGEAELRQREAEVSEQLAEALAAEIE